MIDEIHIKPYMIIKVEILSGKLLIVEIVQQVLTFHGEQFIINVLRYLACKNIV